MQLHACMNLYILISYVNDLRTIPTWTLQCLFYRESCCMSIMGKIIDLLGSIISMTGI